MQFHTLSHFKRFIWHILVFVAICLLLHYFSLFILFIDCTCTCIQYNLIIYGHSFTPISAGVKLDYIVHVIIIIAFSKQVTKDYLNTLENKENHQQFLAM